MKWFIIVLLTANPNVSADVITNPKFDTKELCREYVVKNYDELNKRINEDYSQPQSTPNLFHCVNHKSKR